LSTKDEKKKRAPSTDNMLRTANVCSLTTKSGTSAGSPVTES
jgi:hypothetical protein